MCGVAEARRRIAECIETQGETLDLGGLGLDLSEDAELWQEIYKCGHVKRLFLGLDAEVRKKPYYSVTQNDKKTCNALGALPGALITALLQLEQREQRPRDPLPSPNKPGYNLLFTSYIFYTEIFHAA